MVLRQRKGVPSANEKKSFERVVQDLDAFPKVPETYVEHTAFGAIVAVVTFFAVCALIWSEFSYFLDPGYTFRFVPDADFTAKLTINVDITVGMPCDCKRDDDLLSR